MTPALINQILADCTIATAALVQNFTAHVGIRPPHHLVVTPDEVGHAFRGANHPALLNAINAANEGQRLGKLKALITFLESSPIADTPRARANLLVQWNEAFRCNDNAIVANTADDRRIFKNILSEVQNTGVAYSASFVNFCQTLAAGSYTRVRESRQACITAGLPGTAVYDIIHDLHQNLLPYVPPVHQAYIADLVRLRNMALGPTAAFAGFAGWGPGNHGNIALNIANHFNKHVIDSLAGDALAWLGECSAWWQTLNIQLTKRILRANVLIGIYARVENLFPGGDDAPLAFAQVETFLERLRTHNGWDARLMAWFHNNYENAYRDFAINSSANLTNAIVHTTATGGVFVSGNYNDFFIVGRLEAGVLGISACYVAQSIVAKLGARTLLWPLA